MYRDVFVMFFVAIYEILSGNLMMLIEYLHNLPILFPIENIPQICTFFEKGMIQVNILQCHKLSHTKYQNLNSCLCYKKSQRRDTRHPHRCPSPHLPCLSYVQELEKCSNKRWMYLGPILHTDSWKYCQNIKPCFSKISFPPWFKVLTINPSIRMQIGTQLH